MTKTSLTKIEVKTNKSGKTTFAIMREIDYWGADRGYGVWKLCVNYKSGKYIKTWRYVERDMTLEAAQNLLNKKTK